MAAVVEASGDAPAEAADDQLLMEDTDQSLLLEGQDEEAADTEFSSHDVEELLRPEEEEEPNKDSGNDVNASTSSDSQRGYFRGRGRFMGRGPRMPPPPGFFMARGMRPPMPPFGMGMARPPFGPRGPPPPGYLRPPPGMGMRRGLPLHMMRGGPRGPRPRFMGPPGPPGPPEDMEDVEEEKEESSGPKPLMSIRTPVSVKRAIEAEVGKMSSTPPIGMGMGPKYHPHLRRGGLVGPPPPPEGAGGDHHARRALKRPADTMGDRYRQHNEPASKMMHSSSVATSSYQTRVASNLRQIPTVDDLRPVPVQVTHSYTPSTLAPSRPRFMVSHKPAPALTQIPIIGQDAPQQSANNLRPVSAASANYSASSRPRSAKVLITHLPPSATFEKIGSMTTACGNVRTINVRSESNSAVIEFINPESVDLFIRQRHKKLFEGTTIEVYRMV